MKNNEQDRRKDDKLNSVAEQVYIYAFYGVCGYIVVLTGLIVWQSKNPDNDLQSLIKIILGFVEKMVVVYVIPITLRIAKDALPLIVNALWAWKSNDIKDHIEKMNLEDKDGKD